MARKKAQTFHVSQIDWQGPPAPEEPNFRSQNDPVADRRRILGDTSLVGLAEGVQQGVEQSLPYRVGATAARTMNAGVAGAGALTGALLDRPGNARALGPAVRAMIAAPTTPLDEQTSMSKEAAARGVDLGAGGALLDMVTDPFNIVQPEKMLAALPVLAGVRAAKGAKGAKAVAEAANIAADVARAVPGDGPFTAVVGPDLVADIEVAAPAVVGKVKKPAGFELAPKTPKVEARMLDLKSGKIGLLPKEAKPKAVFDSIMANGGVSINPVTGQSVVPGEIGPAMAGRFPNGSGRTVSIEKSKFTPNDVKKFYAANSDVFSKDHEAFVGGWVSKGDDGIERVYLDVADPYLTKQGTADVRMATKRAEAQMAPGAVRAEDGRLLPRGQEAIFEPLSEKSLEVGNLYEFLQSPEFRSRVDEMAAIGREAMGGENPEWWNILNGPMARVYGRENIEALAGYIASTSPQNGPVANLKMATELMRRHLKDEPIRQVDWRAPATAMGKVDAEGNQVFTLDKDTKQMRPASEGFAPSAGQKFPNLGTYAPNAEKVRAGAPSTITDDKVNDMFHALIGKLVGVFDRHWAKIAEKPEAGIYSDEVINRLAGSMKSGKLEAYPLVENAVRSAAKAAGVDLSKYSAWVWEGIRDTIRKTGKLYGQEHRASAIPETTTGFNELFEDLLVKKAKHLGVSVGKLEQMLRNGDAELLSTLIATPIGAAAYAEWRAGGQSPAAGGPQ